MKVALYGHDFVFDSEVLAMLTKLNVPVDNVIIDGNTLPSIPHTQDSITLLRNLGVEAPTKMKTDGYDFPGRFRPYAHQVDTADFLAGYARAFCLSSPGTGKTASAVWAADYLMKQGVVNRVVVLCPLSCMTSVWSDEIFSLTPNMPCVVLQGDRTQRRKLLAKGTRWVIANHDAIKSLESDFLDKKNGIDLFIVDEATAFKAQSAERSKALKRVTAATRLWLLTGTPIPQEPTDAYFISKLVNPKAPESMARYSDLTRLKVSTFKFVPRHDATDTIYKFMQPAIRFDKADCLDLPDVVYQSMMVPLTPAQTQAIGDIKADWVHDIDGVTITAQNAAIKLSKVMQVACGSIIDNDSEVHRIDATTRMAMTEQLISESASKTIVFVPWRGAISALEDYLNSKGISCAVVHGDVSVSNRTEIFNAFQNMRDPRVLIAHPKTTSHGLTLTAASTTIWFGPTFSGEVFTQANERTNRPSQKHNMRIIMLAGTKEEQRTYTALMEKERVQNVLLDMYKREISK